MTFRDTLALLGGEEVFGGDVNNELELAAAVVRGLPSACLDSVAAAFDAHGVSPSAIYAAIGTSRSRLRKRRRPTRLSHDESDRVSRLARVTVRAAEALGASDKGMRWLDTGNRAVNGRRPITLLASDAGTTLVEAVLGRIENGGLS